MKPKPSKKEIRQDAYTAGDNDLVDAVMAALALFQNEYEVDERCPVCGSLIAVIGLGDEWAGYCRAWRTKCDCGKCDSDFRGL